ncbi:protein NODULATION SIGNALING PATHWAY 2-like [Corylus avellana]|uniref:protein NODULATION SIGNALING PATHWAY 2-like n=1 Tax=Corylus avellana TaxID=13451 RepID=UPI00286D5354|nr:protein NODULATION SIGNALING PATHWAY 2-like [Corylus avellana]
MEYEPINYLFNPSCIDELHECSLEAAFSFEREDLFSPNTIPDGAIDDDDDCLERLLQLEEDQLVEFDAICQDTVMDHDQYGLEIGSDDHGMTEENQENLSVSTERNSPLRGVQEELMQESSLTDLLLMGAEAVEAKNWLLALAAVEKLNYLLIDIGNGYGDDLFKRLALFFTQALHYMSINALEMQHVEEHNNTIFAFQILQELSPYVKFTHFTANQAIIEATRGDREVHVIDFDIMEGIQWPPLMVEIAMRKEIVFRVTAIIVDKRNGVHVEQTGRRLREYADSINLPFMFDQMVMEREEDFERMKVGNTFIANCMIHQLHMPNRTFSMLKNFLGGMIKLSPKILILVEEELFNFGRIQSMSFVEFFCEALHHYTALTDSLVNSYSGVYKIGLRLIEKEFLGSRILESLNQFSSDEEERMQWRSEGFASLKGFRRIPVSSCNISQAKSLVSLYSGGYWAKHERCRLALCSKSRPMTAAYIWVMSDHNLS